MQELREKGEEGEKRGLKIFKELFFFSFVNI